MKEYNFSLSLFHRSRFALVSKVHGESESPSRAAARIVGFWIIGEECGGRDARWNPPIAGFRSDCESNAVITDSSRLAKIPRSTRRFPALRHSCCNAWERSAGECASARRTDDRGNRNEIIDREGNSDSPALSFHACHIENDPQ